MGDPTPDGDNWYVKLKGDGRLFLLPSIWGEVVSKLATRPALRTHSRAQGRRFGDVETCRSRMLMLDRHGCERLPLLTDQISKTLIEG